MRQLHKRAYHEVVVAQFGRWDDNLQNKLFTEKWFPEKFEILELDRQQIGCISVEGHSDHIFFAEIQISPEFQGFGFGTEIIQEEIHRAERKQKPIRLQVLLKNQRAKNLYEKLGFIECGKSDTHFLLQIETEKNKGYNAMEDHC